MTSLPLTLEKRYSVLLPPTVIIRILLVGVGGTGSWLALSLGRLAYHDRQKGITFHLTFVDPDRVEIKSFGDRPVSYLELSGSSSMIGEQFNMEVIQAMSTEIDWKSSPW